jgi:hypothetical protein
VLIVGAGLGSFTAIEKDGRLSPFGYLVNSLIAISCLGTLSYPFLDAGGILSFDCLFRSITGLPCPSCGYSTAIGCLIAGDLAHSFLHNPGWIFWIALQLTLVFIGVKSIITGRQAILSGMLILPLAILIVLTWIAKFIIGPEFY